MIVAVFADAHAHADALEAVIAAAQAHGADELWSLGDMVGRGPDPEHVVARTRECCRVALLGNHDYDALRATEPPRFVRSFALARERLDEDAIAWMRSRRPAAMRFEAQCWHAARVGWWAGLDAQAAACWLLLDLDARTATWLSAPFDPAPAHGRVRELGLD